MKKYTFICEFRGGTYISQYVAENIEIAIRLWFNYMEYPKLSKKEKNILDQKVANFDLNPVAITGVDNVWCSHYLIDDDAVLLNIVETA